MPALGRTLAHRRQATAPTPFYRGEIAERICAYLGERGGLLTPGRLRRQPAPTGSRRSPPPYRGHTVCQLPPNTQGFAALEILGILDGLDVAALGDCSAAYVHTLAEAARLAFQDRDRYLTDPDFLDIPLDRLLSAEHAAELRAQTRPDPQGLPDAAPTGGGTCYLCAVDDDGNAVSLIQSVYFDFGSAVVAGDTGVLMQNRGSFFSLDPAHPNRLEPSKRTFHTLIPAHAARRRAAGAGLRHDGRRGPAADPGRPASPASSTSATTCSGRSRRRAGCTAGPGAPSRRRSASRRDIGPGVAEQLAAMGHDVRQVPAWSDTMGHAQAIAIDRERGVFWAAADPRSDGAAVGW